MPATQFSFMDIRPATIAEFWNYPDDPELLRIINRLKSGIPPQLSIFSGDFGTGKTMTAEYFGKHASCVSRIDGLPCGRCKPCTFVSETRHTRRCAFHELDAVKGDFVKQFDETVRDNVELDTFENYHIYADNDPRPRWDVVFIDEAHRLTPKQQEMLLKPVEDKPWIRFILATTKIEKIDGGLLSRARRSIYRFNPPTRSQVARNLMRLVKAVGGTIEEAVAVAIADEMKCVPRDCLSYLDELYAMSKNITSQTWEDLNGVQIDGPDAGVIDVNW